ncbi:hypothetical protein [Streptomyces sp. CC208A]|uniref:hypothetical protein n=1 Tax=Streptomyces sp. CC208A TaxID=3044573 RepID=UPI0032C0C546
MVHRVEAMPEEPATADAVVLLADHDDFDYKAVELHARYVLDCRNRLSGANVDALRAPRTAKRPLACGFAGQKP